MRLYLITRPGEPSILVCCPQESLRALSDIWAGSAAYDLGLADPSIPPGAVGEFAEVYPIVLANARKAEV